MQIDPTAIVQSENIGEGTFVWQFAIVLKGAVIGKNCNINCHTFVENDVIIGDHVTVKSGIYVWDGLRIADHVFLGPNVVFTNDLRPRSKRYLQPVKTIIEEGASVGANATILAGVRIGKYAMIGIGSVVTRDVPDYALVYGNPARRRGWVDENGDKLTSETDDIWKSTSGQLFRETTTGLIKL